MTVLHKEQQPVSLKGQLSESHNCVDCGFNTAPGCPPRELAEFLMNRDGSYSIELTWDSEMYVVHNALWKAAGMERWGGCLCIGCLEKRIGRKLEPKDFKRNHIFNAPRVPRTERLRDRLGY